MRKITFLTILIFTLFFSGSNIRRSFTIASPNRDVVITINNNQGELSYTVQFAGKKVLEESTLGIEFKGENGSLRFFEILDNEITSFDETWEQPWGEERMIKNSYTQLLLKLKPLNDSKQRLNIVFRAFNDGIAFRYEFPEMDTDSTTIRDELTEFNFGNDETIWWIPAYTRKRYELLYNKNKISEIDTIHTPTTLELKNGLKVCIQEADITDYPSMTLFSKEGGSLKCDLVPWPNGDKAYIKKGAVTPWRTIQIAEKAADLITSYMLLNLNKPNALGDVSWCKPGKYIGMWWSIHLGLHTWSSGEKHGATTANVKQYIDFASQNGFNGVLVEGWNIGWDGDWKRFPSGFSFTNPHPDFDIEYLTQYAKEKGVEIIGHHETGADIHNYEKQMAEAYAYYSKLNINTIKTGYVGHYLDNKYWHHGQFGVRHYQKAIEEAAKHKLTLVVHEPIKPSGKRRTYPNMMSSEGARGMEYNAWSKDGGNPPNHTLILPFTRLLAGPMDFTPGVFDIMLPQKPNNRVNTTLAKQLALYVIIYAPFQMACDLPQNYLNHTDAFQFIKDVPVDWECTKVLNADIGEYLTIVRKDRNSNDWYLGSITNEKEREFIFKLSFLEEGKKYRATFYADAADANWETNPTAYQIYSVEVTNNSKTTLKLAKGGGIAIRFAEMR